MSYYDIDAILTDAEKIPCTFEIDVPSLGYLDNSPSQPLKSGTQLNLPLWLAEMLALANTHRAATTTDDDNPDGDPDEARSFATLNLPPALSNDVAQALKADPRAVALRDQSAHFYGLAARMLDLFEEPDLAAVLRRTFAARAAEVALHARKAGGGGGGVAAAKGSSGGSSAAAAAAGADEGSNLGVGGAGGEFLRGLDEWERKLFRKAHDGTRAGREWMDGVKRR